VPAGGAFDSAQIVLAGGEEDGGGGVGCTVTEMGDPVVVLLFEAFDKGTAKDVATGLGCAGEESLVEGCAGERESGEWERGFNDAATGGKAEEADGLGSEGDGVDCGLAEIMDSFAA